MVATKNVGAIDEAADRIEQMAALVEAGVLELIGPDPVAPTLKLAAVPRSATVAAGWEVILRGTSARVAAQILAPAVSDKTRLPVASTATPLKLVPLGLVIAV